MAGGEQPGSSSGGCFVEFNSQNPSTSIIGQFNATIASVNGFQAEPHAAHSSKIWNPIGNNVDSRHSEYEWRGTGTSICNTPLDTRTSKPLTKTTDLMGSAIKEEQMNKIPDETVVPASLLKTILQLLKRFRLRLERKQTIADQESSISHFVKTVVPKTHGKRKADAMFYINI